mgnify:FL=1
MEDLGKLLNALTIEEKIALVAGTNFMYTNPVPRLNIPSIRCSDGPHGLRVQSEGGDNGVAGSEIATSFPTACCSASSWNISNLKKMGEAIGNEALHYGIDIVLGPGTNIKRNPLAGRNFEYFSEDPLLAGKLAASEINGIQSKGVGVSLKHFALNNAENYRFMGQSIASYRAIREIYLKPFEIAVKEAHPETLMCSYNGINGVYCCQNKWLLSDVLRNEWGFNGLVMTDWGATHDRLEMLRAGLDLEMPGDTSICRKWIVDGINSKELDIKDLDKAVSNVLKLVSKHENKNKIEADFKKHADLAEEIAIDSAVLMKNDGILPLDNSKKYLVVGELFERMRYQGSGSSMINPAFLVTPKEAFDKANISYTYINGYKESKEEVDNSLIEDAIKNVSSNDVILAFVGLTDFSESEGADRNNMSLPKNQLELINALIKTNKPIVLVLFGGSPVELPFVNKINAILNMYLPGEIGGEATRKLLFGIANPSGKLAETWPLKYEDVPHNKEFSKNRIEVYKEDIFVGYRYYQKVNKEVAFPFGFGLSYTSFDYKDLEVTDLGEKILIQAKIVNTGSRFGGEVVELYVKSPRNDVIKPIRQLAGFTKVYLEPNQEKEIKIEVDKSNLRYFNIKENRYVLENGDYEFELSSNANNPILSKIINIKGEDISSPYPVEIYEAYEQDPSKISDSMFEASNGLKIPKLPPIKPINMESRFTDLKSTFMGKILFNAVLGVARKDMKKALKMEEGREKDNKIKGALFLKRILESNSIITMSMSSGTSCPYNFAKGMIDLSNGHIFKGIKDMCVGIKAPDLPKDSFKENK